MKNTSRFVEITLVRVISTVVQRMTAVGTIANFTEDKRGTDYSNIAKYSEYSSVHVLPPTYIKLFFVNVLSNT